MAEKVKKFYHSVNWERWISLIAILYFMFGIVFAFMFAWYYRWPAAGYLSPGFWSVTISWPLQAFNPFTGAGFIPDVLYYGWTGKPI